MPRSRSAVKPVRIQTADQLKGHLSGREAEFFILLSGGVRSTKHITPTARGKFRVMNYIDGTDQILSQKQLFNETLTNIGRAMEAGAFYCGGG